MIPIDTNTFFVRQNVTTSVPLIGDFPDLPLSGGASADNIFYKNYNNYSSGDIITAMMVSGNTNNTVDYGTYTLTGAYLRSYVESSDTDSSGVGSSLYYYNMKDDYTITKGQFTMAQVQSTGTTFGHALSTYYHTHGSDVNFSETFDSLEAGVVSQDVQIGGSIYSGPYWLLSDVVEYCGVGNIRKDFLKAAKENSRTGPDGNTIVPAEIKMIGGKKYYRIIQTDAGGNNIGKVKIPYSLGVAFRNYESKQSKEVIKAKNDFGQKIRFLAQTPLTSYDEPQKVAAGAVSDYWTTKTIQNPFSADLTNPLIYSTIEVTNEGEGINGNALRIYHEWDYADNNRQLEVSELGGSSDLNPQVAMVGLYNIPLPLITDVAAGRIGDRRTTVPHIEMDMNIVRMGPTPLLSTYTNSGNYEGDVAGGIATVGTFGPADTDRTEGDYYSVTGTASLSGERATFFIRVNAAGAVTAISMTGVGNSYVVTEVITIPDSELGGGGAIDFTFQVATIDTYQKMTLFPQGGTLNTSLSSYFGSSTGDEVESLLRSVAVVFSNYKPLTSHDTLDSFLNYGLTNFYGTDGTTINTKNGIVGGVMFRNFGMVSGSDGSPDASTMLPEGYQSNFVYAQALPVTYNSDLTTLRSPVVGPSPTTTDMKAYASGGFVAFEPGALFDTDNTITYNKQSSVSGSLSVLATAPTRNINTNQSALLNQLAASQSVSPKTIELPMNTNFNMKFFVDIVSEVSYRTNSINPYADFPYTGTTVEDFGGDDGVNGGSFMRVIFDTNKPQPTIALTSAASDDENLDVPFLDIPFPSNKTDSYSMQDFDSSGISIYPKYMTIWVQNYRWVKGQLNDSRPGPVDAHFKYGDAVASGSSMQSEVLIDSISYHNFYPNPTNLTASNTKQHAFQLGNTSQMTPFKTINHNAWYGSGFQTLGQTIVSGGKAQDYTEVYPGQYLTVGFNDKTNFPTHAADEVSGYLFFNDFTTNNYNTLDRYEDNNDFLGTGAMLSISSTLSGNQAPDYNHLGNMMAGGSASGSVVDTTDMTGVGDPLLEGPGRYEVTGGAAIDNKFCYASGANSMMSTDGFTQKGFAYMNVEGAGVDGIATYATWGKRENVLASTKIIATPDEDYALTRYQVRVDNPDVINNHNRDFTGPTGVTANGSSWEDEEYIIYRPYTLMPPIVGNATGSKTGLKIIDIDGDVITFDQVIVSANDGTTTLCGEIFLSELYLSPYKYWMTLMFRGNRSKVPRTYGQICMVNETPSDSDSSQLGTTFNESIYSYFTGSETTTYGGRSSAYASRWNLSALDLNSAVELETDYGYGIFDNETKIGGYLARQMAVSGNYLDVSLKGLVKDKGANRDFVLLSYLESNLLNNTTTLISESATSLSDSRDVGEYGPRYYLQYHDPTPNKPKMTLTSNTKLINGETNLYDLTTENINSLKFDWRESDSDIWYRYMIISDTSSIPNKYAHAQFWAPLNEQPAKQNLALAQNFTAYNVVSGTTHTLTNGGGVYSDLTGLSGWAPQFVSGLTTSHLLLPSGAATPLYPDIGASKFSIVAHCIPASNSVNQLHYIFAKKADSDGFGMLITGSDANVPKVKITHAGSDLTSGVIELGLPLNIIYTYERDCTDGMDGKLYVNGALADTVASVTGVSASNADTVIGGDVESGVNNTFSGSIEEVIFYDTVLHIPSDGGTYTLNTSNLQDVDSGTNDTLTHNAKLFTFDYHNIRGKSESEVASSNLISWRATTL